MPKEKINVTQLVEGLNLLRGAKEFWPEGYENPVVQEILHAGANDLNERLIQVLTVKSGRRTQDPATGQKEPKK